MIILNMNKELNSTLHLNVDISNSLDMSLSIND